MARRILNLAAGERIDEQGLTWLAVPEKSILRHGGNRIH
jgi:hypothetical protein